MSDSSHPQTPDSLEEYRAYIYRLCVRFLRQSEEAEDATQQVLFQACAKWSEFRHDASVKTWLTRITTHLCLNRLRDKPRTQGQVPLEDKQGHTLDLPDPSPALSDVVVDAVFYQQLLAAVEAKAKSRKPPWDADDYLIYQAAYGSGKRTWVEVAAILGKPLEYVKYRIYRHIQPTLEEVGKEFTDCGENKAPRPTK